MIRLMLVCDGEPLFDGHVNEVKTKTDNGEITILENHEPYMVKISEYITYDDEIVKFLDGFIYTNGRTCFAVIDKINADNDSNNIS